VCRSNNVSMQAVLCVLYDAVQDAYQVGGGARVKRRRASRGLMLECYKGVTRVLQECCKNVTAVSRYHKTILRGYTRQCDSLYTRAKHTAGLDGTFKRDVRVALPLPSI
jgi:hypothetical protein